METTKSLAWAQIGITISSIIISIIFVVLLIINGGDFTKSWIFGVLSGSAGIVMGAIIIGVMQIIYGTKKQENSLRGIIAGVLAMFTIIPFMGVAGLAANSMILKEK